MALMPLLREDYPVGADSMNPSFSRRAVQRIWARVETKNTEGEDPFAWSAELDDDRLARRAEDLARFESAAVGQYPQYFQPLKELANKAGATVPALSIESPGMAPKAVVVANVGASLVRDGLALTTQDRGRSYRWAALPGVPLSALHSANGFDREPVTRQ